MHGLCNLSNANRALYGSTTILESVGDGPPVIGITIYEGN